MILVDWQIKDRIERGFIKIDPYDPKFVQPNSLDIRLGDHFVWYEEGTTVIDPFALRECSCLPKPSSRLSSPTIL